MTSVGCVLVLVGVLAHVNAATGLEGLVLGDDPRAPPSVTPRVTCAACQGAASSLFSRFGTRKHVSEADVYEFMDGMCEDMSRWRVYAFIPPRMMAGCREFLTRVGDDTEELAYKALVLGSNEEEVAAILCGTTVCKGVDMEAAEEGSAAASTGPSYQKQKKKRKRRRQKKKTKKRKRKGKKKRRHGKGTKQKQANGGGAKGAVGASSTAGDIPEL